MSSIVKPSLIQLHDKCFEPFIPFEKIDQATQKVADGINLDYADKQPLFLAVLNGAFMFAADLLKKVEVKAEISFIKLSSYHGTGSTGNIKELIGLSGSLEGRDIIVIEDIIDTGNTLVHIYNTLEGHQPKSIKVAGLFIKKEVYDKDIPIDYIGMDIPNKFVVGYGLDYDELGRNYKDVYVLKED